MIENEITKNALLDIKSGAMPKEVSSKYNIREADVNKMILVYFNGKCGDELISSKTEDMITDKDKKIIPTLINMGMNKYEIADVTSKQIRVIEKFIAEQDVKEQMTNSNEIELEEGYSERVILKNNAIEVCSFTDRETTRIPIFASKDDYYDSLNKGNEFIEERVKIFVDNNFNKNKYDNNTYNELFKFYTDYYHVSPILISTITKVLFEKKVNFVMIYFNKETRSYHYQWIWNFNDNQISIFDSLFSNKNNNNVQVYINGAKMDAFIKTEIIYSVKTIYSYGRTEYNFFLNYKDCFSYFGDAVMINRKNETDSIRIFVNEYYNNGLLIKRIGDKSLCSCSIN